MLSPVEIAGLGVHDLEHFRLQPCSAAVVALVFLASSGQTLGVN